MKINKLVIGVFSTALLVSGLSGCGTTKVEDATNGAGEVKPIGEGENPAESSGIVAGEIVVQVNPPKDGGYIYQLSIKNDKTENVTLTLNSQQYYDYSLKNEKGEIVYTWSADKMFTQMAEEKVLKPGEYFTVDINIEEGLATLPKGIYSLDVWSTAKEVDTKTSVADIEWNGKPSTNDVDKINTTVPVKYIGQIDNNSFEVTNEEGTVDVYRVADSARATVEGLHEGDMIIIKYSETAEGQRNAESVTVSE